MGHHKVSIDRIPLAGQTDPVVIQELVVVFECLEYFLFSLLYES